MKYVHIRIKCPNVTFHIQMCTCTIAQIATHFDSFSRLLELGNTIYLLLFSFYRWTNCATNSAIIPNEGKKNNIHTIGTENVAFAICYIFVQRHKKK